MNLRVLSGRYAICQLPASAEAPPFRVADGEFMSVTRNAFELSVVCREETAPQGAIRDDGWRLFEFEGPLDLNLIGIMLSVANPLAEAGISIFSIATYHTDYVMVKESAMAAAIRALELAGHRVKTQCTELY